MKIIESKITLKQLDEIEELFKNENIPSMLLTSKNIQQNDQDIDALQKMNRKLVIILILLVARIIIFIFGTISFVIIPIVKNQFPLISDFIGLCVLALISTILLTIAEKLSNSIAEEKETLLTTEDGAIKLKALKDPSSFLWPYIFCHHPMCYLQAFRNLISLENELQKLDLSQVHYISKGIERGEDQFKNLFYLRMTLFDQNHYKEHFQPIHGEYFIIPTEKEQEEFWILPIQNVVNVNKEFIDFSPVDKQFVFFLKSCLHELNCTDSISKYTKVLGKELMDTVPDYAETKQMHLVLTMLTTETKEG